MNQSFSLDVIVKIGLNYLHNLTTTLNNLTTTQSSN